MDWSEPIAGVHPLIWLLIVLVFGPTGLMSVLAANKFGALGALSRWWTNRTKRAIQREYDEQAEYRRTADLAYTTLEADMRRLSAQIEAQGERHTREMGALRAEMQQERAWYESVVANLRDEVRAWQLWGEWVMRWSLRIPDPPTPFVPFYEFDPEDPPKLGR